MPEPIGLAEAGRRLWDAVLGDNELSDAGIELLRMACKQADRADEARRILAQEKIVGVDRFGQEKAHPAVAIERQATQTCANLIDQLIGTLVDLEESDEAEEESFFD